MNINEYEERIVDIDLVKPLIRRGRQEGGFIQLKKSAKDVGIILPPICRDHGRTRPDGTRYEIIGGGEGRWRSEKANGEKTIKILVKKNVTDDKDIAGMWTAENLIRKKQTWAEKGRTIRDMIGTGMDIEDVAARLFITLQTAERYLRVILKAGAEAEHLPLAEAEALTHIPKRAHTVVMELSKETGQSVQETVKEAKAAVAEGAGWSKAEIERAARDKAKTVQRLRDELKLLRLHYALGPQNMLTLLKSKEFVAACKKEKINLAPYLTK